MTTTSRVVLALGVILAPRIAAAADTSGSSNDGKAGKHERRWSEQKARFDQDGDGALNDKERAKMHEAREMRRAERTKQLLPRYDANHNGALDQPEIDKAHDDRVTRHFGRRDANHDAKITKTEAANSPLARHFDKVDANRDGAVSRQELDSAHKQRQQNQDAKPARRDKP